MGACDVDVGYGWGDGGVEGVSGDGEGGSARCFQHLLGFEVPCCALILSWLYDVWKKNFFSTGKLSREDMSMTVILLRMHSHIDTGKRFNDRQDRKDEEVISTRSHDHNLGYTGFSLDDFKCVHRNKSCSFKKRFAPVFKIWPHKNLKNMFLQPISAVCDAIYQGMFALLFIIRQC